MGWEPGSWAQGCPPSRCQDAWCLHLMPCPVHLGPCGSHQSHQLLTGEAQSTHSPSLRGLRLVLHFPGVRGIDMSLSAGRSLLSLGCRGQEGSYLIAGFSLLSRGTGLSGLTLRTTVQTVSSDPAALPGAVTPTASGKRARSPHLQGAPCSLASQAPRLLRAHPGKTRGSVFRRPCPAVLGARGPTLTLLTQASGRSP